MAVSKEDIKKLADLARIKIDEVEAGKLSADIEEILGYVGQVSAVAEIHADKEEIEIGTNINVFREDEAPTVTGLHTADIVNSFPKSENNYLKVKKIL